MIAESDDILDHISISNSDNILDHIIISESDSNQSSQIHFPVSDDEESDDTMDVVKSDKETVNTDLDSESIPNHIVLQDSPMSMRQSMGGIKHDPNTGQFTPSSFAILLDELVDWLLNWYLEIYVIVF